jgi:ribosomal-protein-alanine N-acetyltransferase
MAMLDWFSERPSLSITGRKVVLRPPRMGDYLQWSQLRRASRNFLQPWEPTWPMDDLTRGAFRRRLSIYARDLELGLGYAFLVFRRDDHALVGGISLRDVRRGVSQTATMGYWAGEAFARQGHILDAVESLSRFSFETLALHRIEAACCPENLASRNLLLRAGFQEEGLARAYLKINGEWRDHLLFGLLRSDLQAGS